MNLEQIFRDNLKYISNLELDCNKISQQFSKTKTRDHVVIGHVDLPTGRICVGDALAYMGSGEATPELARTVKPGTYPVEIAVITVEFDTVRICSSRIKFSKESAVRYELAESTHESAVFHAADGDMAGFPVDAGMMGFMDVKVVEEYGCFLSKWHEDNPDKNHYDDYFADYFADSYMRMPEYQRGGGDFIEWALPETGHRIVMNATGFGDGFYQCFWGIDKDGEICELIVPLIDADNLDKANDEYLAVWDGEDTCIVTNHVADDDGKIAYAHREEPSERFPDSGWRFYGYDENDEYWDNPDNYCLYSLHGLCDRFPKLIPILHSEIGTAYWGTEDDDFVKDDGK